MFVQNKFSFLFFLTLDQAKYTISTTFFIQINKSNLYKDLQLLFNYNFN